MTLVPFFVSLLASAIPMSSGEVRGETVGEDPPTRVLLIDIDDVGYDLLRTSNTPNLDWLEVNGRFFTSFTTSPICSPTRAMLQTGAYPSHPDLLVGSNVDAFGTEVMPLAPLEPIASIIAAEGYTTAKIGKWHLSASTNPGHIHAAGWQHYAGVISNVVGGSTFFDYSKVTNGVVTQETGTYLTTDETNDGIQCVMAGIDLVSVSYHAPHAPFHEPPPGLHSLGALNTDLQRARAALEACDRELGRLVSIALKEGYTVLVFSDNGTPGAIGGDKGQFVEGGIVNPFWAMGPGIVAGTDGTRIGAQDLYATLAEMFDVPAGTLTRGPHSRSFLHALMGAPRYRRWSYSERFPSIGNDPRFLIGDWRRAIRGERYKLFKQKSPAVLQLVDLWNDPDESVNLLESPPLSQEASAAFTLFSSVLQRL